MLFPDRVVQMHKVDPTSAELQLMGTIAKPIQKLNRLVQISILQALTSSPDALVAQLLNMARNGTLPPELATAVKAMVATMPRSAKRNGLERLIDQLKKENPNRWRLVLFTGRRETQTTIQTFLEGHGLKVGIINGDSGQRNQDDRPLPQEPARHSRDRIDGGELGRRQPSGRQRPRELRSAVEPDDRGAAHRPGSTPRLKSCA